MVNTFLVKMDHDCDGVSCVTYDDYQAEIARLQAELRSAETTISNLCNAQDAIRRTAHNDAIEEAAVHLEEWGDIYGDNAAKAIRALKR